MLEHKGLFSRIKNLRHRQGLERASFSLFPYDIFLNVEFMAVIILVSLLPTNLPSFLSYVRDQRVPKVSLSLKNMPQRGQYDGIFWTPGMRRLDRCRTSAGANR